MCETVEEARTGGITLRMLGAAAVRLHCPKSAFLFDAVQRAPTDIDLVAYGKDRPRLKNFFNKSYCHLHHSQSDFQFDRNALMVVQFVIEPRQKT